MLLRPEQLDAHVQKRLEPLYVVHGDEPLLVIEAADAIRAAARNQGFTEREVLVASPSFRWDELFLAAGNLSLFGGDKLIDLRIPSGKPGRDGGEALKRYCSHLPGGTVTLVTLPELDWQTKKGGWFGTLSQAGVAVECNAPPLAQLPAWIAARLARQGQMATREALEFVAAHVEGNLLAAHQEILKLGLLHGEGEITREQVAAAVLDVARFDIDTLRTALAGNDAARCARVLEGLKSEGAAPPLVLWALANESRNQCQRNPARRGAARNALLHAARIDRIIKGVAQGDIWDEFLQLSMRLTKA